MDWQAGPHHFRALACAKPIYYYDEYELDGDSVGIPVVPIASATPSIPWRLSEESLGRTKSCPHLLFSVFAGELFSSSSLEVGALSLSRLLHFSSLISEETPATACHLYCLMHIFV